MSYRSSGLAVVIGSVIEIIVMVFHPVGGSFERLIRMHNVAIETHGMAIAAMAITFVGILGLTRALLAEYFLSVAGVVFYGVSMVGGLCAAVMNGIAMPEFVKEYASSDEAARKALQPIFQYAHAVSGGFARVFMVGLVIAVFLFSIAILRTKVLPRALGIIGIALVAVLVVLMSIGWIGLDVHTFGIFVFISALWCIAAGIHLSRLMTAVIN
jgi:hypothetical protein